MARMMCLFCFLGNKTFFRYCLGRLAPRTKAWDRACPASRPPYWRLEGYLACYGRSSATTQGIPELFSMEQHLRR